MLCIEEIESSIDEAFYVAVKGTSENPGPGPVTLMVDSDVWLNSMSISCCQKSFCPKPVVTGNEKNALYEIINRWNQAGSVVMRLGPRVSTETAELMIKLAEKYPQFYVTTVFDARAILSPDVSDKFLDMSGPVGNKAANDAIAGADLIIDAGVGILYTTLVIDLVVAGGHANVIRLFDEPVEKTGYLVNVNHVLKNLYMTRNNLNVGNAYTVADPDAAFKKVLDVYLGQDETIGYYVAKAMSQFYNDKMIVDKDYYQVTDSGTAAFIAGQLLRMKTPRLDGIYTEFSAIGLSMSSAVGMIYGKPKDAVVWLGDGAFMNLMGSLIDLRGAAEYNKTRVLMLLFDDHKYGNVALGDIAFFGEYTEITSTVDLHNNYNIDDVLNAVNPVKFIDGYDETVIEDFNNKSNGFDGHGLYIMKIVGTTTPIVTAQ